MNIGKVLGNLACVIFMFAVIDFIFLQATNTTTLGFIGFLTTTFIVTCINISIMNYTGEFWWTVGDIINKIKGGSRN